MVCCRLLKTSLITLVLTLVVLPYLPDDLFPEFSINPRPYELLQESTFDAMKMVEVANESVSLLAENLIVGPESLHLAANGKVYTGLGDGRLVEIDLGSNGKKATVRTVARFALPGAKNCGDNKVVDSVDCGRVLGLRGNAQNNLVVLEASQGLYLVDVKTGAKTHLGLGEKGNVKGLFNDFIVDPLNPDVFYVTVSTQKWKMSEVLWSVFDDDTTGLIVGVDTKKNKLVKLVTGIRFANSIELSSDKQTVFFSSCGDQTVSRVSLADLRASLASGKPVQNSKVTLLTGRLSGIPDNIRVYGNKLYVTMPLFNRKESPLSHLRRYPPVIKSFARAVHLLARLVGLLREKVPTCSTCDKVNSLYSSLKSGHFLHGAMPNVGGVSIVDQKTGKIEKTLVSDEFGKCSETAVNPKTGDLILGSYVNTHLVTAKLPKKV